MFLKERGGEITVKTNCSPQAIPKNQIVIYYEKIKESPVPGGILGKPKNNKPSKQPPPSTESCGREGSKLLQPRPMDGAWSYLSSLTDHIPVPKDQFLISY